MKLTTATSDLRARVSRGGSLGASDLASELGQWNAGTGDMPGSSYTHGERSPGFHGVGNALGKLGKSEQARFRFRFSCGEFKAEGGPGMRLSLWGNPARAFPLRTQLQTDHAPRTARGAHKQEPERGRAHNERDAPLSVSVSLSLLLSFI